MCVRLLKQSFCFHNYIQNTTHFNGIHKCCNVVHIISIAHSCLLRWCSLLYRQQCTPLQHSIFHALYEQNSLYVRVFVGALFRMLYNAADTAPSTTEASTNVEYAIHIAILVYAIKVRIVLGCEADSAPNKIPFLFYFCSFCFCV